MIALMQQDAEHVAGEENRDFLLADALRTRAKAMLRPFCNKKRPMAGQFEQELCRAALPRRAGRDDIGDRRRHFGAADHDIDRGFFIERKEARQPESHFARQAPTHDTDTRPIPPRPRHRLGRKHRADQALRARRPAKRSAKCVSATRRICGACGILLRGAVIDEHVVTTFGVAATAARGLSRALRPHRARSRNVAKRSRSTTASGSVA